MPTCGRLSTLFVSVCLGVVSCVSCKEQQTTCSLTVGLEHDHLSDTLVVGLCGLVQTHAHLWTAVDTVMSQPV